MHYIYKAIGIIKREKPFSFIKWNLRKIYLHYFCKDLSLFENAVGRNDFDKAIEIGDKIICMGKDDGNFLKKYAKCCYYSGKGELARDTMLGVLVAETDFNLKKVIDCSKTVNGDCVVVESEYGHLGGSKNYGCVKNQLKYPNGSTKYSISKIVDSNPKNLNYEKYFYKEICKKHPKLLSIAPAFYENQSLKGSRIDLITTEYISGGRPEKESINQIIRINGIIESIAKNDVEGFSDVMRMRNYYYIPQSVHEKRTNKEMLSEMKFLIGKIGNGEKLRGIVCKLENMILGEKLYKRLKTNVHYSFCQNDFHKNNIIAEENSGRCFVVDWNNYGIAVRGWDMNRYFSDFSFTFDEIEDLYIKRIKLDDCDDEKIAKLYFAFMQIYIWMKKLRGRDCNAKLERHFVPAIAFIEETCKKL